MLVLRWLDHHKWMLLGAPLGIVLAVLVYPYLPGLFAGIALGGGVGHVLDRRRQVN